MTKLRNKILLVLLALCFVACMGLLVACGGDDDKKPEAKPVTYTVTVKAEGEAVKGVKVTVKKGTVSFAPKTTGDDGKVEFSLAEDSGYTVELADLPANYEVLGGASLSFPTDRNLTVNLAERFAYKVKLVNPNGSPFVMEGVSVGICDSNDTCRTPVAIDANGLARIESTKEDYHIQVLGLPAGYAYESDRKGYSMHRSEDGTYIDQGTDNTYNSLSATVFEQTVTIYPVNVIDFTKITPLTPAEIAEYNDANRTVTGDKAYKVQATVPANSTAYYTFTPEYSGKYTLYPIAYNSNVVSYRFNELFWLGDINTSGSGTFNEYGQEEDLSADKSYYINITNKQQSTESELEFILTTPVYSKDVVTDGTTVTAFINEGANAVIALAPTAGASYSLTVKGVGAIAQASSEQAAVNYVFTCVPADEEDEENVSDYKQDAECKIRFTNSMVGRPVYFAVSVKAESYPVKIDVAVTKLNDLTDNVEKVAPTAPITKFGAQTGKELVDFKFDGTESSRLEYNETDKFYHYGSVDGPLVVVMLTKKLPEGRAYFEDPIIYLERGSFGNISPYVFDVTSEDDLDDLTKGNSYKDYRFLLRGFDEYKSLGPGNRYGIPTDLTDCYASNVNEDGVYPLTKGLEAYLKRMVEEDSVLYQLGDDVQEDEWLFACYYYDTYVEPDVIVGEYSHVMERIADGDVLIEEESDEYALVINKRGTYKIQDYFGNSVETGTWVKTDNEGEVTYTFTKDGGTVVYTYFEFNEDEGTIEFYTADVDYGWKFRNDNNEIVDVIVGDYEFVSCYDAWKDEEIEVDGTEVTAESYKLTVNADGTFMVYEKSDENYEDVYSSTGAWKYKNGEYTFTVPGADYDLDWNPIDLVFAVDYNIGTGAIKLLGSDTSTWEFKKDGDAFVGLYELVSFTDGGEVISVGATYGEGEEAVEITKDYMELYVVGNTVELTSQRTSDDEFNGTWTKTNGGKYVIIDSYYGWEYTARYNKGNNTVTLIAGDTTYVFQKKASQTIDALVGEYYVEKMVDFGDEKTVANGDLRSDDYKLVVKASGKFAILEYGYPEYVAIEDDGYYGTWEKTSTGYAFAYYVFNWDNFELEPFPYTVTVGNDLTEIVLESEELNLGWTFSKAELEAPVAPDAIVDEYKLVIKVDAYGITEKVGDNYRNMWTGEEVNVTADSYHLVVLNNGRYVIVKLEDGQYVTETRGLWSKDGDEYAFYDPTTTDAATYGDLVYAVEYNEVLGRVALISDNNGLWIFQKFAAETIEAVNENNECTVTVDGDEYTVYTFGMADMNLLSENEDARLCLFFNNGGVKFYYYSEENGNVLAAVATAADFESETLDLTFLWKEDGIATVVATRTMEEEADGTDYSVITVVITYTEGEPATYVFKSLAG